MREDDGRRWPTVEAGAERRETGGVPHAPGVRRHTVTTASDVAGLGTILGVWAHPDDEAYLSAGLMRLARRAGSRVVCVTATRGELGTPDPTAWPPELLAEERSAELRRSLDILGVAEHHWLGYRDGRCAEAGPEDATQRIAELIEQVTPDTVVTFGPDGITGHPDHQTVGAWATAAFRTAARPGARILHAAVPARRAERWAELDQSLGVFLPGWPVTVPDESLAVALALDAPTLAAKVRALAAQRTQTAGLLAALGVPRYTAWVAEESFVEPGVGDLSR